MIEHLLIETPFPKPFRQIDLEEIAQKTNLKLSSDSDISQEQLAVIWLEVVAPGQLRDLDGIITKEQLTDQATKVSLCGYVAYLTLLIRLTRSYLAGEASGSIFTSLIFDWTRYLGRNAALAGYRLSPEYDNLIDQADTYAELEKEKGVHGMLDDKRLHSLAQQILLLLEQFWTQTKQNLGSSPSIGLNLGTRPNKQRPYK